MTDNSRPVTRSRSAAAERDVKEIISRLATYPADQRVAVLQKAIAEAKAETKASEVKTGPAYTISEAAATYAAEIALRESAPAFEVSAPVATALMQPSVDADREQEPTPLCRCCDRRNRLSGLRDPESRTCTCTCCVNWRAHEAAVDDEIDRDDDDAPAQAPFRVGNLLFTPATEAETKSFWSRLGLMPIPAGEEEDNEDDGEGDEGDDAEDATDQTDAKEQEAAVAAGPATDPMEP